MSITIHRYHGLENDYLVYDNNRNPMSLTRDMVMKLCDRHKGIGADGILEGPFVEGDRIRLRIWNPDGSIEANSGNGVRIFARYLKDMEYTTSEQFVIETDTGSTEIELLNQEGSRVRVSMGKVSFLSQDIPVPGENRLVINEDMVLGQTLYPVNCVSIGNPHCVILLHKLSEEAVTLIGEKAHLSKLLPDHINTTILKVHDREHLTIETYESGVGYVQSSGTGACAAAAVAYRLGMTSNQMNVTMPGGQLEIEVTKDFEVHMTGSVVYIGRVELSEEFVASFM